MLYHSRHERSSGNPLWPVSRTVSEAGIATDTVEMVGWRKWDMSYSRAGIEEYESSHRIRNKYHATRAGEDFIVMLTMVVVTEARNPSKPGDLGLTPVDRAERCRPHALVSHSR